MCTRQKTGKMFILSKLGFNIETVCYPANQHHQQQQAVWPVKSCQMSIKVAQNDLTRKMKDFDTFKKLPKNVGDLGKLIVATGFEMLPKVQ